MLRRYGDDLYRLAVLLTPDEAMARALLQHVVRTLREQDSADIFEIAHALFADARTRRTIIRRGTLPEWVTAPTMRSGDKPLLAAIARLPHAQRFALGLATLPSFEADHHSLQTAAGQERRVLVRDALVTLLPLVDPALDRERFDPDQAPEECRTTRAALLLDMNGASTSSEVRGHLALCEVCRQTARDWRHMALRVAETLRDALRPIHLPEDVAWQAIAAAHPDTRTPARRLFESRWMHRALLPLAILFLIALIVWPRSDREEPPVPTAAPYSLNELIERAEQTLYTPSPGEGAWQGGYLIRWTFADQTYANLRGDLWIHRESGEHRIQLVHQQGGGPYEFQLADSRGQAWYAIVPSYSATLGFPFEDGEATGIQTGADADLRQRLFVARLESGAWATPRLYLAQARQAALQSWGRRQLNDGTQAEVIGFRGASLLGFPPDAPNTGDPSATILLTIDSATGVLREIRELIGPVEGEQVSRLVWMFDGGREVDPREEARIFGIAFAWRGQGTFVRQESIGSPQMPLIPAEAIIPLEQARGAAIMLPDPTPDMVEITLARDGWITGSEAPSPPGWYSMISSTPGRWLTIRTLPVSGVHTEESHNPDTEQTNAGPYEVWLRPDARWRYRATVIRRASSLPEYIAQVEAQGYTRAEFLALLASLDRVTPERLEQYKRLSLKHATETVSADKTGTPQP